MLPVNNFVNQRMNPRWSQPHQNQLRCYAAALRRLGLNPVRLAIHDLDTVSGGRTEVRESDDDFAVFHDRLHAWIAGISERDFAHPARREAFRACELEVLCRDGG
jgi:hypothetical protein